MRLPGLKQALRSFRRARSRLAGGIVVLGYHRVSDDDDPFELSVSVRHFAAHMELLARTARPMRLAEAVAALADGPIPRRSVVVTFDDGYSDTLHAALPLMQRAEVPATVFVTSGCHGQEFWWDELTRIVMDPPRLPDHFRVSIRDRVCTWTVAEPTANGAASKAARRRFVTSVAGELRPLGSAERGDVMRVLRKWAESPESGLRRSRARALTVGELTSLSASPHMDIGAHTVSHPVLPLLTRDEQRAEIQQCRTALERITGRPVTSFSYPNGAYSAETLSVVAATGYTLACCSTPDVLGRWSNPLTIPRLWVGDSDATTFGNWLNRWLPA